MIMSISGLTLLSATLPSAVGVVQANDVNLVQERAPEKFVGAVRWAVQNRVRRVSVGVYIPRVSLS